MKRKPLVSAAVLLVVLSGFSLARYRDSTRHEVAGAPADVAFVLSEAKGPELRMIAVGDTGTGDWRQRRVARAMEREALARPVELVLVLGDLFYKDGVESVDDPQWEDKFEEIYENALDDVTFRPVAGNHDHLGDSNALVAYSARSTRWAMPALYYAFEHVVADWSVAFFALDTTLLVTSSTELAKQLEWLAGALAASNARWKIVFGHHPVHTGGDGPIEVLLRELEPILLANGVDLYLAGHDHYLGLLEPEDGVRQVISGAGAKPEDVRWTDDTRFAYADLGFAVLRATRDELEVRFLDDDGEVLFARQIAKTHVTLQPQFSGGGPSGSW